MADQPEESDLRRRAAWLLAMLAVVAVLFVILLTVVLDSSGGGGNNNNGTGPDDTLTPSVSSSHHSHSTKASSSRHSSTSRSSSSGPATRDCPTQDTCALQGDIGNAIDAINTYRAKNGQKRLPGSVSKSAQDCAVSNGSNCKGGWAESQVASLDGSKAVDKISKLGKLLDPQMKSFGIGWAYSPKQKQYYFAIVRK